MSRCGFSRPATCQALFVAFLFTFRCGTSSGQALSNETDFLSAWASLLRQGMAPNISAADEHWVYTQLEQWGHVADAGAAAATVAQVLEYTRAHEAAHPEPLFARRDVLQSPAEWPAAQRVAFVLQQFVHDYLFTREHLDAVAGVAFPDAGAFPGAVRAAAERVRGARVVVNATYVRRCGAHRLDEGYALRPLGYYAPPGEVVEVEVGPEAVGRGLELVVGAHSSDLQFGGWQRLRRFPRIMKRFPLTETSVRAANPFGGGLYLVVPLGSRLPTAALTLHGAVKAPHFDSRAGSAAGEERYNEEVERGDVQWVDWEGDDFMFTLPLPMARALRAKEVSPAAVLGKWEEVLGAYSAVLGRAHVAEGSRAEYLVVDCHSQHPGLPVIASYPLVWELAAAPYDPSSREGWPEGDYEGLPVSILRGEAALEDRATVDALEDSLQAGVGEGAEAETEAVRFYHRHHDVFGHFQYLLVLHELGHGEHMPTLMGEWESNVNLPAVAAFNTVFGEPLDTAFRFSTFQGLDREEAAVDWMLSSNFARNARIGVDHTFQQYELPWQARANAKLVDLADLFGWEAVSGVHAQYSAMQHEWSCNATTATDGIDGDSIWHSSVSDDHYIGMWSRHVGVDLCPLFHFWGVIPSPALAEELRAALPASAAGAGGRAVRRRLAAYRAAAPRDASQLARVYNRTIARVSEFPMSGERWTALLHTFDHHQGAAIVRHIDNILCRYFPQEPPEGVDCAEATLPPPVNSFDQVLADPEYHREHTHGGTADNSTAASPPSPLGDPGDLSPSPVGQGSNNATSQVGTPSNPSTTHSNQTQPSNADGGSNTDGGGSNTNSTSNGSNGAPGGTSPVPGPPPVPPPFDMDMYQPFEVGWVAASGAGQSVARLCLGCFVVLLVLLLDAH